MKFTIDRETLSYLNCDKIALEAKPTLLAKPLNKPETLVVVVDMINGFAKKGALASDRVEAIIPDIKSALEQLTSASLVFVRDEHNDKSQELKYFPPHCMGDKESKVVSELSGFKALDLAKNSTNAFFALAENIDISAYNHVLIMGCCTDICILQLALSLRSYLNETNNPLPITIFTDYLETFDSPLHNADLNNLFALKTMETAGIQIYKKLV